MSNGGSIGKIIGIAAGAVVLVGGGVFLGVHFTKGNNNMTVQETAPAVTAASETQPEFVVIPATQANTEIQQNAAVTPVTTTTTVAVSAPVNTVAIAQQTKTPVIQQAKITPVSSTMGDGYMFRLDVKGDYDYWIATYSELGAGDPSENNWYTDSVDSRTLNVGSDYFTGGSSLIEIKVSVVPYYNNGTAGNPITANWKNSDMPKTPTLQYDSEGVAYPSSYSGYSAYSSPKSGYCNVASCYIRNSADTNGTKTEQRSLYKLDPCVIYGEVNGFYYISTDSGSGYDYYGYVQKSNLKIGTPPADPNRNYNATSGYVSADSANLRSTPSKENNSNIICSVKKGMTFTVLSFDGYWYYISCEKGYGYLSYKMVTVK